MSLLKIVRIKKTYFYLNEFQEQAKVSLGIEGRIMVISGIGILIEKEHREY